MMKDDPCFRCTLPDCDEENPACLRKQVLTIARRKAKSRIPMTSEERGTFREYQREWMRSKRSELKEVAE